MTDAQAILIAALEDVTALAVCFEADRLTLRDRTDRIWGETPRTGDLTADVARLGRWQASPVCKRARGASMTDRPISFKDPLVLAIEAGRKTVTRRLIPTTRKVHGEAYSFEEARQLTPAVVDGVPWLTERRAGSDVPISCPYPLGSRLWVKQRLVRVDDLGGCITYGTDGGLLLDADGAPKVWPWKPKTLGAMYCPRWASRLTLEITGVHVERLQDITEADAIAEGVEAYDGEFDDAAYCAQTKAMGCAIGDSRPVFALLWDSINRDRASWAGNPWVWRIAFRKVQA